MSIMERLQEDANDMNRNVVLGINDPRREFQKHYHLYHFTQHM